MQEKALVATCKACCYIHQLKHAVRTRHACFQLQDSGLVAIQEKASVATCEAAVRANSDVERAFRRITVSSRVASASCLSISWKWDSFVHLAVLACIKLLTQVAFHECVTHGGGGALRVCLAVLGTGGGRCAGRL
eukprot:scaffold202028_cov21-Tisochrysis_lutea.AAC.1